jgi:UDP-N-acetylglucosamine:LPS N-acetylglucosamine transferase
MGKRKIKLAIVVSSGGPLEQVYCLRKWWKNYDRFWITFENKQSAYLLKDEKKYFGFYPEHRNVKNALKNFVLAFKLLKKETPDILFGCGAGLVPPFFLAGKILGCRLIFLESAAFISKPSLSGRFCYLLADDFLIQHGCLKKFYPKAKFKGCIL